MTHESTILIVDDQRLAQKSLEALLKQEYQLAFANNGSEALALAPKIIPDLILLDIVMPDMDGFEVCRRLRRHPVLAEVPVIMLTALDDRESRLKGIEAGADDFVSKPFDSGCGYGAVRHHGGGASAAARCPCTCNLWREDDEQTHPDCLRHLCRLHPGSRR